MISHKSIATLGIGFGTLAVATVGFLTPAQCDVEENQWSTVGGFPMHPPRRGDLIRKRRRRADEALLLAAIL